MTVVPAYGRDYKSAAAAKADWDAGKDFKCVSIDTSGGYVSKRELGADVSVTLRYDKLRKVMIVTGGKV